MKPRYAMLVDGGFMTKALAYRDKKFPTAEQVKAECLRLTALNHFSDFDLLRIYYYDAPPANKKITNPVSQEQIDLGATEIFRRNSEMLDAIEQFENFALRKGETVVRGWSLGDRAAKNIMKKPRAPTASDLVPNVEQKGVDLRIGLDIARLSLRQVVQAILIITGDSDMIPAFKFARREGMRIYLHYAGMPVRPELKAHADMIVE